VGGGDAFMAGMLHGLASKKSITETINFATAISALKHTIAGDAFVGTSNDVEEVLNQIIPGKINR
jgi:2-dehydro-3-deoxygluconokinase